MVELQPSKLVVRVRFPSPALCVKMSHLCSFLGFLVERLPGFKAVQVVSVDIAENSGHRLQPRREVVGDLKLISLP